ncbi:transcriptional regulator [Natronospirillum operosum]|uniref:Transcriptional regulator n=1 Tax=Natronospirillum operosum TaxID=2759953 RepID=A0A4Z0W335_9GAMM|nr:SoxR reducing system RseC family protein [Natronospirillum operosum]TGG91107.1 transcriptional regulator [Natronospirillum operosum]
MIEEQATVVAVEQGRVGVETLRQSACQRCSARAGCGQPLLSRVLGDGVQQQGTRLWLSLSTQSPLPVAGQTVIIGIPEQALLRAAFWLYLFPVLALVLGATLIHAASGHNLLSAFAAVLCFAAALLSVHRRQARWSRDSRWQPRLLRTLNTPSAPDAVVPEAVKVL